MAKQTVTLHQVYGTGHWALRIGKKEVGVFDTQAEARAYVIKKYGGKFEPMKPGVAKSSGRSNRPFMVNPTSDKPFGTKEWHEGMAAAARHIGAKAETSAKAYYAKLAAMHAKHAKTLSKVTKRKNVSSGKTIGTGRTRVFHPFRSSPDYDPSYLHDAEGQRARAKKKKKASGKKIKTRKTIKRKPAKKPAARKGSKRSAMTRYRATENPSADLNDAFGAGKHWITSGAADSSGVANARVTTYGFSKWWNSLHPSIKGNKAPALKAFKEGVAAGKRTAGKKTNPKRKVPAAFLAAAKKAKAMSPAQRAAWAKKMQAARKAAAKRKGK